MYQIHESYWSDGTRILDVDWGYEEAFAPEKSRMVVQAYLLHYGRNKTLIEIARIHNGGPGGYEKDATLPYAQKIEEILKRKEHKESCIYKKGVGVTKNRIY